MKAWLFWGNNDVMYSYYLSINDKNNFYQVFKKHKFLDNCIKVDENHIQWLAQRVNFKLDFDMNEYFVGIQNEN